MAMRAMATIQSQCTIFKVLKHQHLPMVLHKLNNLLLRTTNHHRSIQCSVTSGILLQYTKSEAELDKENDERKTEQAQENNVEGDIKEAEITAPMNQGSPVPSTPRDASDPERREGRYGG